MKTEWGTSDNASVNETEFAFQVEKSQIYNVRVRAVNRLGAGEPSDVINVKLTGECGVCICRYCPAAESIP